MFGQNNQPQQDNNPIPDHSIDGVINAADNTNKSGSDWQHPGAPLDDNQGTQDTSFGAPAQDDKADGQVTASEPVQAGHTDDLIDIKQQALGQLAPLVDHLDQTPEERFRTTMMMIQASDNQSLLRTAYDAAQAITDEKARAQALLDVVNEINYFTQQHEK